MSKSKKGKKTGKDHPNSKPVYCIELDRTFVTAVDAEQCTGILRQTISLCCLRKNKSTHGGNTEFDELHWIFEKDKSEELIYQILHEPKIVFSKNVNSGINGVYWDQSRELWAAQIRYCGARHFLGRFVEKNEAVIARLSAEKMYYGDFAPQANLFKEYNIQ